MTARKSALPTTTSSSRISQTAVVPGSTSAGAAPRSSSNSCRPAGVGTTSLPSAASRFWRLRPLMISARGRCADTLGLLQALAQGLVLDEAPGVLHGVDQRAFAVARRRLGLLRLHAWMRQCCTLAVDEPRQRLVGLSLFLFLTAWFRLRSTEGRLPALHQGDAPDRASAAAPDPCRGTGTLIATTVWRYSKSGMTAAR